MEMEEGGTSQSNPRSVEAVFKDFTARRDGLLKALTTDVDDFFAQCVPEKDSLCLFGLASGNWEVKLPSEEVPPDLPEPSLGINFARDMMKDLDWLTLVAVQSDAWLLSVAHYYGAKFGFGRSHRIRLFNMINELPTLFETMFDARRMEEMKARKSGLNSGRKRSKSSSKGKQSESQSKKSKTTQKKEKDKVAVADEEGKERVKKGKDKGALAQEEGEERDVVLCSTCGEKYTPDEFWVCCHICQTYYHGRCAKIRPRTLVSLRMYKCLSCFAKLPRPLHRD